MINRKWQKIIGLVLLIAAITTVFILYFFGKELSNNHQLGYATITKCEWASRSTARFVVGGTFTSGNEEYYTSCQLTCQSLKLNELREKLIGLKLPVVFLQKNPSVNYLLIEQKDYDHYNVVISDSLLWVNELVRCR